jgi:hypothetical protein
MGDLGEHLARREVHEPLHEVETCAPNPSLVQFAQLGISDGAIDGGDAACLVTGRAQRIDQRAIVGAVAGGLDDDVLVEAQSIAQREELLLRGIRWRVLAFGRVRKHVARPEDVAMCIHRSRRDLERRCRGIRVIDEPPWRDLKTHTRAPSSSVSISV